MFDEGIVNETLTFHPWIFCNAILYVKPVVSSVSRSELNDTFEPEWGKAYFSLLGDLSVTGITAIVQLASQLPYVTLQQV